MDPRDISDIRGNSFDSTEKKPERPKVEKVVLGPVVMKKPGIGRLASEIFTGDDLKTAGRYVVADVIFPAIRKLIYEAITEGGARVLFGEVRRSVPNRQGSSSYVSYGSYYSTPENRKPPQMSPRAKSTQDFGELTFQSKAEVEAVISTMAELIDMYERASVADVYSMVGMENPPYTAQSWGWIDIRQAGIERKPDGYHLILPKPIEFR